MQPFDELGVEGQRRRVRLLAQDVVAAFGLTPDRTRIRRAAESFNTIFKVEHEGHARALRVGAAERIHAEGTELVEAQWMRQLGDDGVTIPRIFESLGGSPVVRQGRAGVTGERICMMFGWVRGAPLSRRMSADAARQMGTLAASLHDSGPQTDAPHDPPVVADRALYWKVENRLPQLGKSGSVLEEARSRVQEVLDELWRRPPHRPRLLHGDLTPDNVLVGADGLVPIDFQDMFWGFDIQDLAITLTSFGRFSDVHVLRDQFRAGYVDVRAWPDLDDPTFEALEAARRLHQINLALTLRRPGRTAYVERGVQRIAGWMR